MSLLLWNSCGDTWCPSCAFIPCALFQGGKSYPDNKSLPSSPEPLGRSHKCYSKCGWHPAQAQRYSSSWCLDRVWSLGQIWNGILKANIGSFMIETCQIMCQECLIPSPWRAAVFKEKTQLWKWRHSMHYPYLLKLEQNPRKCRHLPSPPLPFFPLVIWYKVLPKLFCRDIPHGGICQATVPFLLVQLDARRWEERCGGGKLNKTFKNQDSGWDFHHPDYQVERHFILENERASLYLPRIIF